MAPGTSKRVMLPIAESPPPKKLRTVLSTSTKEVQPRTDCSGFNDIVKEGTTGMFPQEMIEENLPSVPVSQRLTLEEVPLCYFTDSQHDLSCQCPHCTCDRSAPTSSEH